VFTTYIKSQLYIFIVVYSSSLLHRDTFVVVLYVVVQPVPPPLLPPSCTVRYRFFSLPSSRTDRKERLKHRKWSCSFGSKSSKRQFLIEKLAKIKEKWIFFFVVLGLLLSVWDHIWSLRLRRWIHSFHSTFSKLEFSKQNQGKQVHEVKSFKKTEFFF